MDDSIDDEDNDDNFDEDDEDDSDEDDDDNSDEDDNKDDDEDNENNMQVMGLCEGGRPGSDNRSRRLCSGMMTVHSSSSSSS